MGVRSGSSRDGGLDGFVRDAHGTAVQVSLRQALVGREVEVREDGLASAHAGPFRLDRLLHLHDHVRFAPYGVGVRENGGPSLFKRLVLEAAALTRGVLDEHLVALRHQRLDTRGHQCHTILVGLDFLRNADLHDWSLITVNVEPTRRAHAALASAAPRGPSVCTLCLEGAKKSRHAPAASSGVSASTIASTSSSDRYGTP